jgi:haloalkane dehalogenase
MTRRHLSLLAAALVGCQAARPSNERPTPETTPMNAMLSSPSSDDALRRADVHDSFMAYRELGTGRPIVLLHGNPTSSYVWRNVMPQLATRGRCLAPDLIGMGHSGKPELAYRFQDHARYLDAWFDALGLRDVVVVGYDWGGVLAVDWARRHEDRVAGVVVFETMLQPLHWSEYPPKGAELFRKLRTPGVGEAMVLERNEFLDASLRNGVKRGLSDSERAEYLAPFPNPSSRRPMLQWTRELPIDGDPADVTALLAHNAEWLGRSSSVPKLLLTFESPLLSNAPAVADWARREVSSLEVVPLGVAGHHAPEDAPEAIGRAMTTWIDAHQASLRANVPQ